MKRVDYNYEPILEIENDYHIVVLPNVYPPSEDTWLTAESIRELAREGHRFDIGIDIGCGCGILSLYLTEICRKVVATDINPVACFNTLVNAKLNCVDIEVICTDTLEAVRDLRIDIVVSNPPYLPDSTRPRYWIEYSWYGGVDGRKVIDKVLEYAVKYLRPGGYLVLTQSSYSDIEKTVSILRRYGFDIIRLTKRSYQFFEDIICITAVRS